MARSIWLLAYLIAALIPLATAVFLWPRRAMPAARWLLLLLAAAGSWVLTQGIGNVAESRSIQILGAQLSYVGTTASPVLLLLFALEYTRRVERVSWWLAAPFFAVPAAAVAAVFTNDTHHLIWTRVEPLGRVPHMLVFHHGPLYWLVAVYGFALSFVATLLVLHFALKLRGVHLKHGAGVAIAVLIPWTAELLYAVSPVAVPWYDSALPVGVGSAVLGLVIMRHGLLLPADQLLPRPGILYAPTESHETQEAR